MATTKEPVNSNVNSNSNVNNITNNIHLNTKKTRRSPAKKAEKEKPNWILKAIIIAAIGLAASLIVSYLTTDDTKNKSIESNTTPIQPIN